MSAAPPEDTSKEQLEEILVELRNMRADNDRLAANVRLTTVWVRAIGMILVGWIVLLLFLYIRAEVAVNFGPSVKVIMPSAKP